MKGHRFRTEPTWIYYIQSGPDGPIKIGIAKDPWQRLRELQTGNPVELSLLGIETARVQCEAERHLRFAADRITGEWFTPTAELYTHIREVQWMNLADAVLAFPKRFDDELVAEITGAVDEILAEAAA